MYGWSFGSGVCGGGVSGLDAFSKYVPMDVVKMLLSGAMSGASGAMGWRDMTILFADIVGFTTMCEQVEPDLLMRVTAEYLQAMCGVIVSTGGVLDKVPAFFSSRTHTFMPTRTHAHKSTHSLIHTQSFPLSACSPSLFLASNAHLSFCFSRSLFPFGRYAVLWVYSAPLSLLLVVPRSKLCAHVSLL